MLDQLVTKDMTESRPRIIFHIGQHKTGTKALQSFLYRHADGLNSANIFYPTWQSRNQAIKAYAISHYQLYVLLLHEVAMACGDTVSARQAEMEKRAHCEEFPSMRAYFMRICRVPDDCIDASRRALFVGREAMRDLIEELRSQPT
jgi:hypothetical protein